MEIKEKPTARQFGAAVRATLKELGLDMKVKVRTIGFSGFGYGEGCTATILTGTAKLTDRQVDALRQVVRRFRDLAGGPSFAGRPDKSSFMIDRLGVAYPFGGTITHKPAEPAIGELGVRVNGVQVESRMEPGHDRPGKLRNVIYDGV